MDLLTDFCLECEDEKLMELIEVFRNFPEWFTPHIPELLRHVYKVYSPGKDPETLEELIEQNPPMLIGTIFEVVDTGDTWSLAGLVGPVPYCKPLQGKEIFPMSLNTRIRRVF